MNKSMVIMMGIQGSGKSTFYKEHLASRYVRVNLDTLKTRNREKRLIEDCIFKGKDFAIDNTNPTAEERARYITWAKQNGYKVTGYFMESKLKPCIERNNKRTGAECVPAKAIAATSNKLQMPSFDEGFDELYFVKNDGENMTVEKWR